MAKNDCNNAKLFTKAIFKYAVLYFNSGAKINYTVLIIFLIGSLWLQQEKLEKIEQDVTTN